MLRWPRSLAVRAVAALIAVHVLAIFLGLGLGILSGRKTAEGGADVGQELAAMELRFEQGRWVMPTDGAFASLAARNPGLWLVGADREQSIVLGRPPDPALVLFGLAPATGSEAQARGGAGTLLANAVIAQERIGGRTILLAVGGVDPSTVTRMDVLRTFSLGPALALLTGFAVMGLVAVLLAIPLLSRALRPVIEDAALIGPDGIGRLDEMRTPMELQPLARALNGALDRLEAELGRRKRLISNVAHELRTPLAVLSLRVDSVGEPGPEREALRAEVDRLTRVTEQMLALERLSLQATDRRPLDLAEAARSVTAALAPVAMDAGYELELETPGRAVEVLGDPVAVERAITNLVGNAIAHAGGRGEIRVVVDEAGLEVRDEGPGVSQAVQPRLFEAFARGGEAAGSGLGLHLTREIMRGLGGEVSWRREGRQTTFRLQFPAGGAATGGSARKG
ncbi:ATP-binding protein [Brevundimonas sp. 2R-24]|uniref:histidine kinase n=1 Tax=Peiella sedimenti TaxID=3061083 RepID=A0ABT8SPK4_9CAUL|nr:ATP-binding protein [Caulobacteraceae bacterium XZ-24]